MEAIIELFAALLTLLVEVTWHSLVFLVMLCLSAASPRCREKMRSEWNRSVLHRAAIISGVVLHLILLGVAVRLWLPMLRHSPREEPAGRGLTLTVSAEAAAAPEPQEEKGLKKGAAYLLQKLRDRGREPESSPQQGSGP